ncbi:MAG TPA: helix-turn-helix domain-containing protein [Candidatus Limnocylindrales bacterium]
MGSVDRAAERASRRATVSLVSLAQEIRSARVRRGLSQSAVGRAARVSRNQVSLVERAAAREASLRSLMILAGVVGLELSVRAYPAGPPVRDAGQLALLGRLRARLPASARWSDEVPLPVEGDRRAWDAVITLDGVRVAVEAETRLLDVQAVRRRLNLKLRDDPSVGRLVLLIPATRTNRATLRTVGGLGPDFPLPSAVALRSLAAGRPPDANATVFL